MKNSPWRAEESSVARTGLRIVCSIMLLIMIHEPRGKVINCHFNAADPMETTSASPLRKSSITSGAKAIPVIVTVSRKINPTFTQNQNPYRTRLFSPAP